MGRIDGKQSQKEKLSRARTGRRRIKNKTRRRDNEEKKTGLAEKENDRWKVLTLAFLLQ